MIKNLYVDNVMILGRDADEARSWYKDLKKLFGAIAMNIRQFVVNDEDLMSDIPVQDRISDKEVKVLGVNWNLERDAIVIRNEPWAEENPTKRKILKFIHSHFDPYGFLALLLLPWQVFYQSLWLENLKWDDKIPKAISGKLEKLKKSWTEKEYEIPRRRAFSLGTPLVDWLFKDFVKSLIGQFLLTDEQ